QRLDDGAEGRADDDADGQVDDVALQREGLELLQEREGALARVAEVELGEHGLALAALPAARRRRDAKPGGGSWPLLRWPAATASRGKCLKSARCAVKNRCGASCRCFHRRN